MSQPASQTGRRIAIAGGGTGGHVMPALALGEALLEGGDAALFLGARRGMETRLVPQAGFELVALDARPLVGQSLLGRARGLLALAGAALGARRALRRFGAELVISVGGYAAMPALLAARVARLPVVLMEPNALPGVAHRVAARFAARICVASPEAGRALGAGADDPRVVPTGVPLRRELVAAFAARPEPRVPTAPFRVFVFGGSQGARQINDWLVEILPRLDPKRVRFVHQTGEADRERVAQAYAEAGVEAEVTAFERDMPGRYGWCDLVVCRAGALTVAEVALAGRAALFVPLVHTGGGEQLPNALALEACGAALVLDPRRHGPAALADALEALFAAPERLREMGRRAAEQARPDAARRVVAVARALLEQGSA